MNSKAADGMTDADISAAVGVLVRNSINFVALDFDVRETRLFIYLRQETDNTLFA